MTPVLEPQATTVNGVFPGVADGTVWYDWYTGHRVAARAGANTSISAPLGHIPVYLRGGSVTPLQEPGYTTTESRKNPWGLVVALSSGGKAAGSLYVDDGESIVQEATLSVGFEVEGGELRAKVEGDFEDANALGTVKVLGVWGRVGEVRFNGKRVGRDSVEYDRKEGVLEIKGLNEVTKGGAWKGDWTLSWGR